MMARRERVGWEGWGCQCDGRWVFTLLAVRVEFARTGRWNKKREISIVTLFIALWLMEMAIEGQ